LRLPIPPLRLSLQAIPYICYLLINSYERPRLNSARFFQYCIICNLVLRHKYGQYQRLYIIHYSGIWMPANLSLYIKQSIIQVQ